MSKTIIATTPITRARALL